MGRGGGGNLCWLMAARRKVEGRKVKSLGAALSFARVFLAVNGFAFQRTRRHL